MKDSQFTPLNFLKKTSKKEKMILSISFDNLPPEMVEKILKLLNIKDICKARGICKRWKEIIVNGNLVKKVAGKILE